ncbi:MAG: Hsp20/alpha crystallin family protein [Cyanobacteria bacterium REEB67]|nr:Hsp20/alpha crystallin family protein [Cyanobacteria bacterium REEB67]
MTGAIAEHTAEVTTTQSENSTENRRLYAPPADIYEANDKIFVLADMPGVSEQSLDITLEKNVLTIQGFTAARREEGLRLVHCECPDGNYRRVFLLSEEIDREHIEATVSNGVLKLVLPKSPKAKARKIEIKAK